ncbi:MAG: adenosylcobalamin-dependent ribonucleoside-diphosphate reductase [Salinivirgaceae bacterium]|nr:adenosylcobalamin-dependent ribonucleoside-diphosphate reductase [Salinivirgaceae bacterium]
MLTNEMVVPKSNSKQKFYTYDEAMTETLAYFKGDKLAASVWLGKYALKDSFGNLFEKSPADMHWRIANEIARIEARYPNPLTAEQIFETLDNFKYIVPQGSPMAGIGNNYQVASLSNCFVIGNKGDSDSYGGIMKIDQEQVQLMKRRGGVGHDLSHIRPSGSQVKNSALTSTGLVPFMERYSNSTREVAQDGRRGALMLSVSVKHPDSEQFIDAKLEQGKVTGANISVKIDDDFMRSIIESRPYTQQYPVKSKTPTFTKEIDSQRLWDKIVHNAWRSAEPGILFWDTILRESIPDCYAEHGFETVSTNPCGEIPLCPYDSCRLLAINLYGYVENPFTTEARFNFELFKKHAQIAHRMMDDIIDLEIEKIDAIIEKINSDPEAEDIKRVEKQLWMNIRRKATEGRRTGIGITAEGDMLAAMGLIYGTDEATDFSVEVHKTLTLTVYSGSVALAQERGAFPIFDAELEKKNPFINRIKEADPELYDKMVAFGRRNIAMLTVAPTGSTSILTQTTSGIEPVFKPIYRRNRKVNPNDKDVTVSFTDLMGDSWETFTVIHHKFIIWLTEAGYNLADVEKMEEEQLDELVAKSPYHKATANDVDWLSKVRMQGAIQKWVDHSISVTVNLPENATEELVGKVYSEGWKSGCKGITVYRDGSRTGVLISNKKDDTTTTQELKRPNELECDIVRFKNNSESWIAFIGLIEGRPYEIFTGMADDEVLPIPKTVSHGVIIKNKDEEGVTRYDFQYHNKIGYRTTIEGLSHKFNPEFWNYAKLISSVLRYGMPIERAIPLIDSLHFDNDTINTWKAGVGRALKKYIPNGTEAKGQKCKNCRSTNLIYQEGCLTCSDCGSSECG